MPSALAKRPTSDEPPLPVVTRPARGRVVWGSVPMALAPDDPRQWALLFTRQRLRKGWSYLRLSVEAGLSERVTVHACTTGRCHGTTVLKLAVALQLVVQLPAVPRRLSHVEVLDGR